MLYLDVCRFWLRNRTPDTEFVTFLDCEGRLESSPGGTEPCYVDGQQWLMLQASLVPSTAPRLRH